MTGRKWRIIKHTRIYMASHLGVQRLPRSDSRVILVGMWLKIAPLPRYVAHRTVQPQTARWCFAPRPCIYILRFYCRPPLFTARIHSLSRDRPSRGGEIQDRDRRVLSLRSSSVSPWDHSPPFRLSSSAGSFPVCKWQRSPRKMSPTRKECSCLRRFCMSLCK